MEHEAASPPRRRFPLPEVVVAGWVALVAGLVVIGADLLWVVAMGDVVRADRAVPDGIPFASAPQTDWANPVVVAQVLLSVVHAAGWWALPALHLVLVAATLMVVVADGRRLGGTDVRISAAVSLVVIGGSSALVVLRFPSLSLLPFVVLVALLRRRDDRPGPSIWWVPPLMVLWGNLHGAVLVGLAVLAVFVVAARGPRLRDRALVGVASLSCLLVTSAGWRTPAYYVSALGNEAARRGTDLWARPDLSHPLDVAMILAAVGLLALAARSLRAWEWLVTAGLALATVSAARHGIWLLLFLAPVAAVPRGHRFPAAAGEQLPGARPPAKRAAVVLVAVVGLALVAGQLARRSELLEPPGSSLVAAVQRAAGATPVMATEPEAETFAQAGIRVWAANPVDAFTRPVQADFLDFLHDCTIPSDPAIRVVVVDETCRDPLVASGWLVTAGSDDVTVLTRPAP